MPGARKRPKPDCWAARLAVSIGAFASVFFLSCCPTSPPPWKRIPPWNRSATPATERPAEITLEKWVGRGMMLQTKIRLQNGTEFPCALDTGSPTSTLPTAAEPMLGQRLGSGGLLMLGGPERQPTGLYAAPKIYLGNTLLETGGVVETWNNNEAILGMDCLCHYCIQLDFAAGKIRFLDPEHLDTSDLGKPFPLLASPYAVIEHAGLFQRRNAKLLIDTGCSIDGCLEPRLFKTAVRDEKTDIMPVDGVFKDKTLDLAELPKCVWDGEAYTDLIIGKGPPNIIGMRFLARHLVTFNFPKGVMYLKRVTGAPLQ